MPTKPVIGLIQGDPAGIGSELMVKLLLDQEVRDRADIAIIGAPSVISRGESVVGDKIDRVHVPQFSASLIGNTLQHIDLEIDGIEDVPFASVSASGGQSALAGLELGFKLSSAKQIDGICFMPFNKESMHLGGNQFLDEIGFARDYFGIDTAASEFNIARGMWNGRVTSHVAMKHVHGLLS